MSNKIKYITGDLLALMDKNCFDLVAHGCNCFHVMGSGIAKQFADTYPEVCEADFLSEYGDRNKLGDFTVAYVNTIKNGYPVTVVNLYTQYTTGGSRAVSYDAVYDGFAEMSDKIDRGERIGLPLIGAGLGGGSWSVIEAIINDTLIADGHDVTVVEYKP